MKKISDYPLLSDTAMVLAAGLGVRMRPLTDDLPKPLIRVGGRTMLDLALDKLSAFGLRRAVVNAHYLAHKIESHLKSRRDLQIVLSREETLLNTGGGVKKVLPFFGGKPFFVLGGDLPYLESHGGPSALTAMAEAWDPAKMDVLLLVMPRDKAHGFGAKGDFFLAEDGRLLRRNCVIPLSHVYISVMLVAPQMYVDLSETAFSNNDIFDRAEAAGRLYGLAHRGSCFHIGTPPDLEQASLLLETGRGWGL